MYYKLLNSKIYFTCEEKMDFLHDDIRKKLSK